MTRKSIKTRAQETVVAAGKSADEGTKTLAGELAHAAAAALRGRCYGGGYRLRPRRERSWGKVAAAIGAKKSSSRTKKKVVKKVASKKRITLKKSSRRSAKKKQL